MVGNTWMKCISPPGSLEKYSRKSGQ